MIAIIDYGMGNLRSVVKKFENLNVIAKITQSHIEIKKADKLILPGVGHFRNGVKNLMESGIWNLLNQLVLSEKKPILGICLGMQLMANFSEEGDCNGLGWFDAEVVKFKIDNKLRFKVPHMGWNHALIKKDNPLLKDITSKNCFYFVHSYHINCKNADDILMETEYEYTFTSAISKENIFGVQFHPEKSHKDGEELLLKFANL